MAKCLCPTATIGLDSDYEFAWIENGETRNGSLGRNWWIQTDDQGIARTLAAVSRLNARVYSSTWKPNLTANVKPDEPTVFKFHRKSPGKRSLKGQVLLPAGSAGSVAGTEIQLFAMDRGTKAEAKTYTDSEGKFSVDMDGARLAAFAKTSDGSFAGSAIIDDPEKGLQIQLAASGNFKGQLYGKNDLPLANKTLQLTAVLKDKGRYSDSSNQFDLHLR